MATTSETGLEALRLLKSTEPPLWLAPNPSLSEKARTASQHLFAALNPFSPKSPFDHLLTNGFDAEQIWQQIDLQSQPLLSSLRREVKKFEKNPDEIVKLMGIIGGGEKKEAVEERERKGVDEFDDVDMDEFDDDDDDVGEEQEDEEGEKGESGEGESEDEGMEEEGEKVEGEGGIEDKFLNIKELQEYLEEDEAREYGLKRKKNDIKKGKGKGFDDDDDDEEEEEDEDDDGENGGGEEEVNEEDEDEEDDELGVFGDGNDEDQGTDKLEHARYKDFFGSRKKKVSKGKSRSIGASDEDSESDDEQDDGEKKSALSTHEKQLEKYRSKIEQMEKENLGPKDWTMRGEVTAEKRPKNSALEVDLDFEHNVRPAPVITEEVTASLEDMIQKRILEGRFDDVQKAPSLLTKAPRELKELDENKSKKGLAEVYEEEYVQKTNPASAPLSFSDEQKKEASMLFKKLCLKLDALSHFHFAPKPVIEDMSVQVNVPALAMEEIAPMAVSDAAMLAPEEVFTGKGDIKEEVELTQAERKRRRANKKRKFKAEESKRMAKKTRDTTLPSHSDGVEE